MIWVIANNKEEDGTFPTYRFYKKAFRDNEIGIYCAGANDDFSFITKDDIVLVRTRCGNISEGLRKAQEKIGFMSTLESPGTNHLTWDKEAIKGALRDSGVLFPKTVKLNDVEDGVKYFVKPRCGENSKGIDEKSICSSKSQVIAKCMRLEECGDEPIIEEYIDGREVTTAVIFSRESGAIKSYSAFIDPKNARKINTDRTKKEMAFKSSACWSAEIGEVAKKVFYAVGAQHHIRIDFRMKDGLPYVLDVNMIPGLAPNGYMSACMEGHGISYYDLVKMVVESAF